MNITPPRPQQHPEPATQAEAAPAAGGPQAPPPGHAGGLLTIDLAAIVGNYRRLQAEAGGSECAAVVKADAYGLGVAQVAPALCQAGCRTFFVAHLEEGLELRRILGAERGIAVLHGASEGSTAEFVAHDLIPVLNSLEQIAHWRHEAVARHASLPAMLHVDTGMARLGLPASEVDTLAQDPDRLRGVSVRLVVSHLACADQAEHPLNAAQLAEFARLRARLPASPASLAASSGIFLGAAYRFDLVRPGAALYGIAPTAGQANPMAPVIRLQGRVMQVREIPPGATVGYGATFRAQAARRIATVSVGYADGFSRAFGNRGAVWLGEWRLPIVGRVSMDSLAVDATDVAGPPPQPGMWVDLIGPRNDLDEMAAAAGTIGYELLTSLGRRYARRYVGA